ncbi:hypothetical protein GBAR_LOCUS24641 [Geodia barretti]|uniref:Uncharacterized protein n=1 Tax=Geodia barretti TaxID=519541 RepID=A0AA35TA00_GEOBA|nr:hypothetical protein GBAR_LOCUS24641 [Geodia barretti]
MWPFVASPCGMKQEGMWMPKQTVRIYQTSSKNSGGRKFRGRSRSPDVYSKRSSINRPVLRLQVKPETLTRQGIQTTNGVSEFRRSTLRKLAQSGVPYENLLSAPVNGCRAHTPPPVLRHNLNPPTSLPPHTLPTPSLPLPNLPRRSHSLDALDSMIIIQYVENDSDLADGDSDSHLARLSYARMKEVKREEEHFGNITISRNGSPPIVTPSTSLGMINGLMNGCSQFRRCRSTDALSRFHSSKGWKTFQSASSEDEDGGGMEWSLGESIMKAMSQHGLTLFNIDNPTSASEHEVNKAWPQLRDKMKMWKSQHSLDKLESSSASEDTIFRPHPITITAH